MLIDNNMTKFERDIEISNHSGIMGLELFHKCQNSQILTPSQKKIINANLCIAYAKNILKSYVTGFEYGTFSITFGTGDISAVYQIAQELQNSDTSTDEYQA